MTILVHRKSLERMAETVKNHTYGLLYVASMSGVNDKHEGEEAVTIITEQEKETLYQLLWSNVPLSKSQENVLRSICERI